MTEPWKAHAACKGMDTNLFYPEAGPVTNATKAVCDSCPVQADCLQYAIDTRAVYGFWGGESADDLRRAHRSRTRQERKLRERAARKSA